MPEGLPLRSKCIAAQKLANVPVVKRGKLIAMQHLGYADDISSVASSAIKEYNEIYETKLAPGHREALSELFSSLNPARTRRVRRAVAVIA